MDARQSNSRRLLLLPGAAAALAGMAHSAGAAIATPDHVLIVIEENHTDQQIIGNSSAPYINSLAAESLYYNNSHGVEHPSQPNYLDLFSGSNQGVIGDATPAAPFATDNLAHQLVGASKTFTAYSDSMPSDGYSTFNAGSPPANTGGLGADYAQKHNPTAVFSNLGAGTPATNAAYNKVFNSTNFPTAPGTDYSFLPTVSYVVPNQQHDMHGESGGSSGNQLIADGDTWLQTNISAYLAWAKTHNSLLIFTFDENDNTAQDATLNQIPTFVDGASSLFVPGVSNQNINHFNILGTLEDEYGLSRLAGSVGAPALETNAQGQLIPEPATLGLFGMAGTLLLLRRRHQA